MRKLPYAEDVGHYWQTSTTGADTWMLKAKKLIEELGGLVTAEAFAGSGGQAAFMLAFTLQGEKFKIIWPVLPTITGKESASRIQAATLLYHDVKAKAMAASVLGAKVAFFSYILLPDGRAAADVALPEFEQTWPLALGNGR